MSPSVIIKHLLVKITDRGGNNHFDGPSVCIEFLHKQCSASDLSFRSGQKENDYIWFYLGKQCVGSLLFSPLSI